MKKINFKFKKNNIDGEPFFTETYKTIKDRFTECPDIVFRQFELQGGISSVFIYVDGMVDIDLVQRDFIAPIIAIDFNEQREVANINNLPIAKLRHLYDVNSIVAEVLSGSTVFLCNNLKSAISTSIVKFEKRQIQEPITEKNLRGPHEGFLESLSDNIAILRRHIKNDSLKFKKYVIGKESKQTIVVAYIENIANPMIIDTLYQKIKDIDTDGLNSIGNVEQFIVEFPMSPFPQYYSTERPDKVYSALLEGRVALLLDGTPYSLIAPVNFFSFFQALDDYSTNWIAGSLSRSLRYLSAIFSIYLPAFYIAITSFHYYMIPTNTLIPILESRQKVPFAPVVETLLMIFVIEMTREASIRLPTYIGITVGVAGGIVLGQAAVEAGFFGSFLVVIIALTSIGTFLIPSHDMVNTVRVLRLVVIFATSIFGIIGMAVVTMLIFAHLLVIESLGQPYFQPILPLKLGDLKDIYIRPPVQFLKRRPENAKPLDKTRGSNS